MHGEESWTAARARGLSEQGILLICDVAAQRLEVLDQGRSAGVLPVSTALAGVGSAEGSHRTPTGWHAIAERIGAGAPLGTVFRDRQPTGEVLDEVQWRGGDADLILSRILWLTGLEEGVNRGPGIDSHGRYIYLHGTNREDLLGQPASRGCIRIGNRDAVDLFERVSDRPAWCVVLTRESD